MGERSEAHKVPMIHLWQCPSCYWLQGTRNEKKTKMICDECHSEMNLVPDKMWKFANGKELSLNTPTYKDKTKRKDIWMCQNCCQTDEGSWRRYYENPCCINCDDGTLIDDVPIMDKIILKEGFTSKLKRIFGADSNR